MKKKDIKKLTKSQAIKDLEKLKKDLFNFRFQKVNSKVTNPAKISLTKKIIKSKKKYSAHDEKNEYKIGDKVSIVECKPYSKRKKFEVFKIK